MADWFSSDELKEIKDSVPKLPAPSDLFAKSLERFCAVRLAVQEISVALLLTT
jgi:hypothetical protein